MNDPPKEENSAARVRLRHQRLDVQWIVPDLESVGIDDAHGTAFL
jgi:hypothetical protein